MAAPLITVSEARGLVLERVTAARSEPAPVLWRAGPGARRRRPRRSPTRPRSRPRRWTATRSPPGRPGARLTVVGESRAGTPSDRGPGPDEAIRISTGAAVPDGADAVIPQENVIVRRRRDRDHRRRCAPASTSARPGRTCAPGARCSPPGTRLGGDRARGRGRPPAWARSPSPPGPTSPSSAPAMSCARPGEPLGPGEIHNSNAPMLTGLAAGAGAIADDAERLPDDRAATRGGIGARARARRGGDHLRRGLGRPPRPRQARAGRARRRGGVLERRAAARQADLVRSRSRTARSCSGCRATPSRPWSRSRCSSPRRSPRCRVERSRRRLETERRAGRRRAPQPAPRAGDPRAPGARRRAPGGRRPTAPRARTSSARWSAPTRWR